jgi:hypothetical protein
MEAPVVGTIIIDLSLRILADNARRNRGNEGCNLFLILDSISSMGRDESLAQVFGRYSERYSFLIIKANVEFHCILRT